MFWPLNFWYAAQVMKLGGLEILDGWMDGDVEVCFLLLVAARVA